MNTNAGGYRPDDIDQVRRILIESADESPEHTSHEQLAAYLDGNLDRADAEVVQTHLEDCAACREDLEDLRIVRRQLNRNPLWKWVAAAAIVPAAAAALTWFSGSRTPRQSAARAVAAPPAQTYENAAWQQLVTDAVQTHRLPESKIADTVRGPGGVLRGGPTADKATLEPAGVVIDNVFPRFRWPAFAKAFYRVTVASGDEIVLTAPLLSESEWLCDRPLERGRTYTWQVEAHRGDGPSMMLPSAADPPAMFHIISAEEHAELQAAAAKHPDDHLLLAVLSARAGMRTEAREQMKKLATLKPANVDVQRLLSNTLEQP